jgi:hypothetical protein
MLRLNCLGGKRRAQAAREWPKRLPTGLDDGDFCNSSIVLAGPALRQIAVLAQQEIDRMASAFEHEDLRLANRGR